MDFKKWLEETEESEEFTRRTNPIDHAGEIFSRLNMTRGLPLGAEPGQLNRSFHLNTIIGRLYGHWQVGRPQKFPKGYLSPRFDLIDKPGDDPHKFRNKEEGSPNDKFWAAYKIWQSYIRDVVATIPSIPAKDIHSGKDIDFLKPTREIIKGGDRTRIVKAMKTAFGIVEAVLGGMNAKGAARDYGNFMDLLSDILDDDDYREAARDFYEFARGSRKTPEEDIADFLDDQEGKDIKQIQGPGM